MIVYDLLYLLGLLVYLPYGLVSRKVHRGWWQRCGALPPARLARLRAQTVIWMHAVSVGEVRAAGSLIRALEDADARLRVVLTTTTQTGWGVARGVVTHPEFVFYSPLDLGPVVGRFLRAFQPRCLVLMESELWPNLLAGAARAGVPVVVANGRVSPRSFARYRMAQAVVRRWLRWVTVFLMQTSEDARRIIIAGAPPDRVRVVGNLKFDQPAQTAREEHLAIVRRAFQMGETSRVWVCGSTHPGEEEIVLAVFRRLRSRYPDLRLIIAPRHPARAAAVARLVEQAGFTSLQASRAEEDGQGPPADVVLLDMMGQLPMVYHLATVVFVGGSLVRHGGHNLIEPAQHGKPILVGPHVFNFQEVVARFVERGAVREVHDEDSLVAALTLLLDDRADGQRIGELALRVIRDHEGATRRSADAIRAVLAEAPPAGTPASPPIPSPARRS